MQQLMPTEGTGNQKKEVILMVLVDGEQETEPVLNLPGKYKETNNTPNPCLDVFSFFPGSFWFCFLLTVNKNRH